MEWTDGMVVVGSGYRWEERCVEGLRLIVGGANVGKDK
jgi:hypothetical protein